MMGAIAGGETVKHGYRDVRSALGRAAVWLLLALMPPAAVAAPAPEPQQDFIVVKAGALAYGFRFEDLLVLDPHDGSILSVLPMTPALPEPLVRRPGDRLQLFPLDSTWLQTVIAPGGQTLAYNRLMQYASSTRMHSYVWHRTSGELLSARNDSCGFALLGEEGDHLALFGADRRNPVAEFQVWDLRGNRPLFAARFPEVQHVRVQQLNSTRFALFVLDDNILMLWDQQAQRLQRIPIPEGRALAGRRGSSPCEPQQGNLVLSADERWLAFIAGPARGGALPGYYLIDLAQADAREPVSLPDPGNPPGTSLRWVSFGRQLLGTSEGTLHRMALGGDVQGAAWAPTAWVAQDAAGACNGSSSLRRRDCLRAQEQKRGFLPADALLETLQVELQARYVASNDATLLAAWDSYNNRPFILDATHFPPRELSPARPDASAPAGLYLLRPGLPRDAGRHPAPGLLRFSHFGEYLLTLVPESGTSSTAPVRIRAQAIPELARATRLNPELHDYLRARNASPGLTHPALCQLEPAACTAGAAPPPSPPAPVPERVDIAPQDLPAWMRPDPARQRTPAPELCHAFERIRRPIQGEPFFIGGRYAGIRIAGQGETLASDPAIPFRDGDILFDGGWCASRACSADEFGRTMQQLCLSRGRNLVRAFVLEVGSADPARNRAWILLERH